MRSLSVLLLAGAATAQAPRSKPVATTLELMQALIVPASDALFEAAEKEPRTDAGWAALRTHALVLTEAGNLLMMDGHARDKGRWMRDARAQVDAGIAALNAIAAKDLDKLIGDVGEQIVNSCENCHAHYLKRSALRSGQK